MMYHLLKSIFILCIVILSSCEYYPKDVERALLLSGENKENLVAVLEHYKNNDSQKYVAACFLIANMPYHKSNVSLYLPYEYQNYFNKIDSIYKEMNIDNIDSIQRMLADEYAILPLPKEGAGKADIETLTKDFLIHNIDAAFDEWYNSPLLKKLSFDDFKELVLPYRTTNEPLIYDRINIQQIMHKKLSYSKKDNIYKIIEVCNKYVKWQKEMNKRVTANFHIGVYDLFIPAFKMDCHNLSAITCNIFRACGIPVVYEFTPQWPDKDSKHYWCSSPDSVLNFHPYTPPYNNLDEDWDTSLKYVGKVYRMTFGIQKNTPYFLRAKDEHIPVVFNRPTMIDVTSNYHICTDIILPAPPTQENKLAYLSFFNTQGNNPVAWGSIDTKKKTVRFQQVPVNMLFFPTYIDKDGNLIEFASPFVLRQNSKTGEFYKDTICCNHRQKQSMHLLRKYPPKPHLLRYLEKMKGILLLASNKVKGPYDTLYVLAETPKPYWQRYKIMNNKKFHYYKMQTKDLSPINIAEYEFLYEKDNVRSYSLPNSLPIFDSLQIHTQIVESYVKTKGIPMRSGPLRYQACDENLDTYVESAWCGMEYEEPICVEYLQLYPRNARNGIEPNNNYQLLYYDNGKWVEYAIVHSTYNFLDFASVPSGTIYWLRNLDDGKEELPFFYRDGKQSFINQEIYRD